MIQSLSYLKTDEEGRQQVRFYTSDQEGTCIVEVQGLTKELRQVYL